MDESSFYFEPDLNSGVFESADPADLTAIAERVRYAAGSEVAAVLDLSGSVARLALVGSPVELSDEKEAVLMAWLQEAAGVVVRPTPPKLALAFGCHELLVVPIESPAALLGAVAVSLPTSVRRASSVLASLAAECALTLEAAERRSSHVARARSECPTEPAPAAHPPAPASGTHRRRLLHDTDRAPAQHCEPPAFRVVHAGRW
ncbi:MAG: hypothetical protein IPI67_27320 [Myxococcales bacterium]|nr:hypothetical protein [Myxococcales bacterium]